MSARRDLRSADAAFRATKHSRLDQFEAEVDHVAAFLDRFPTYVVAVAIGSATFIAAVVVSVLFVRIG